MKWTERITVDPNICKGRACVTGTRIMVSVVLDNLAARVTPEELIRSYPPLAPEDVQPCLAFAATLAQEQVILLAEPSPA
jgi:uncharacterized protein (DUF433 family)